MSATDSRDKGQMKTNERIEDHFQVCTIEHGTVWQLVSNQFPSNKVILTRPTVGRVKPLLDLHRLCSPDAIMIPYKAWTWDTSFQGCL